MKTIFVEARTSLNLTNLTSKLIKVLRTYKKICLLSTVQHIDSIKELKLILEKNNKQIILSKGSRCKYPGQVLGCDVSAAKGADAYVFLGTGAFHPIAIASEIDKPLFIANPFTNEVNQVSESEVRRYLTKRAQNASKVRDAKVVGILATVKPGQNQLKAALALAKKLKTFVFLGDTIDLSSLRNFSEVQAWVNTCCPRMADDAEQVGKPIANIKDLVL